MGAIRHQPEPPQLPDPVSSTGQALATPGLRLVNPVSSTGQALPSYSPGFNADEAIWGWARQEATANLCLGTRAAVEEKVSDFFAVEYREVV